MRSVLIAAAALVALASPAQAAAKHTWYYVNILERKCELSPLTPEEFATYNGVSIPAENAHEFPDGIVVRVDAETKVTFFFTNRKGCETVADGLRTRLAPHDDTN
jgi:hypothetical protein